MAKKIKPKPPVHDERCGDCYYNEDGVCSRDASKCIYNIEPVEDEEDEE